MIQILLLRPTSNGSITHLHPHGFPTGLCVENSDILFRDLGTILEMLREKDPDNLRNVYYTEAHHSGTAGGMPSRTKLSYEYQTTLTFDLDHVDLNRAYDYLPVVAGILDCSPQRLVYINTGNGLHFKAHLKTPIRSSKYLDETRVNYSEVVYRINMALKELGLPGDADPSVWDAPRVFRLPNTINEKKGVSKEARLLCYPGLIPLDLDIIKLSGLDKLMGENIPPSVLKKSYPRPDFPEVASQCEFMKACGEKPELVHEPQFQMLLGLLGAMSPGDKMLYRGQELTAKEFAEAVFNQACNSASLARGDFDRKWEHGIRYGAPKCQTVSSQWIGGCEKCPHYQKINTPLRLKSEAHISSSETGYWVMGEKAPKHPHYSDLVKVYRNQNSYLACEPERVFVFDQTHYKQLGTLTVNAWVDKTVGFGEYLREAHCVEFLKLILRSGATTLDQEKEFFDDSIRGKMNFSNGILDIRTGVLEPHSDKIGFRYCLPYAYDPDAVSGFFLDWLSSVMLNRTELMDALLDSMAYCLWPEFNNHIYTFFTGDGANGKGTLMGVIRELVGPKNCSAVSLSQLATNRFAGANLAGKLVNLCEEASGARVSFDEMNIIKDLSGGGTLMVEHKNQAPFELTNFTKLIFSANKPPTFSDQGHSIQRRMLVIPFDAKFEVEDPSVKTRLSSEVPAICSMLVKRIQENLKENGQFLVSRGGAAGKEAQEKVLRAGSTVYDWGKEYLESSVEIPEDKYVTAKDVFAAYKLWCEENNERPMGATFFGRILCREVLLPASHSRVISVGGKNVRVYPRVRWKEVTL